MRRALKQLPPDLDRAFEDVFDRIHSKGVESRDLAFATLSWVLNATRPLTVFELLDALSVEELTTRKDLDNLAVVSQMLECCVGLVVVEGGTHNVHFAHYRVQEYLLKISVSIQLPDHSYLALICLTYLNFEDFRSGPLASGDITNYERRLEEFPLFNYASCNWTTHMRGPGEENRQLLREMETLFKSEPKRDAMLQMRHTAREHISSAKLHVHPYSSSLLHVLAGAGLTSVVEKYLHKDFQSLLVSISETDSTGRTPLHEACRNGHWEVVRRFLQANDYRAVGFKDKEGATPLHLAAEGGHARVIELLLNEGKADTQVEDAHGSNPLHRAMVSSHTESANMIMQKCVERYSGTVERRYTFEFTLLHQAA